MVANQPGVTIPSRPLFGDEKIAAELKAARNTITAALQAAWDAGLEVSVQIIDVTNISSPVKCFWVSVEVVEQCPTTDCIEEQNLILRELRLLRQQLSAQ